MSLAKILSEDPTPKESGSSLISLSDIFEEEPVPLKVFVQDKKFLGSPSLSPVQYDAVRYIERIYMPDLYPKMGEEFHPYWADPVRMVNYINIMVGKGGGKDFLCTVAALRVVYLLICLKSPQEYFGMPDFTTIHTLNVASNAKQALVPFFTPLTRMATRGWFDGKSDPKKESIQFTKNIESFSGHSKAESQEGMNLILAVADEIDAFETEGTAQSTGRESTNTISYMLNMLRSSAVSRFPRVHKQVRISYPRYIGSPIMKLMSQSNKLMEQDGVRSNHIAIGPYATWEANPLRKREDFDDEYNEDPILAAAKYECKPSFSSNPFFKNEELVELAMVPREQDPVMVDYELRGHGWEIQYSFAPDFYPVEGAIYSMHADMAINKDRAGIAMSHIVRYEENHEVVADPEGLEHIKTEVLPVVKTDFILTFEADLKQKPIREIQIRWARQLCFHLQKMGFNIAQFTYDGFQSKDSMQILEATGIASSRVSTDLSSEAWFTLRDLIYSGRITIPKSQLIIRELLGLVQKANGKIDHLPQNGKDAADALAASVLGALVVGGCEVEDGSRAYFGGTEFHSGEPLALAEEFKGWSLSDVSHGGLGIDTPMHEQSVWDGLLRSLGHE